MEIQECEIKPNGERVYDRFTNTTSAKTDMKTESLLYVVTQNNQ